MARISVSRIPARCPRSGGDVTSCGFPIRITHGASSIYLDADAIVILEVFAKKSRETPQEVIETCKLRLKRYQDL